MIPETWHMDETALSLGLLAVHSPPAQSQQGLYLHTPSTDLQAVLQRMHCVLSVPYYQTNILVGCNTAVRYFELKTP